MTFEDIRDAVKNHVVDGLKGVADYSFSEQQLLDEVIVEYATIVKALSKQPYFIPSEYSVALSCLTLDCKDLTNCCGITLDANTKHFEIPKPLMLKGSRQGIIYVGQADYGKQYAIYTDPAAFRYHTLNEWAGKLPYVYISMSPNKNNLYDGFVFNIAKSQKLIRVEAIFENPNDIRGLECCVGEITVSSSVARDVINNVSQKYITYYSRLAEPQPNIGAAIGH